MTAPDDYGAPTERILAELMEWLRLEVGPLIQHRENYRVVISGYGVENWVAECTKFRGRKYIQHSTERPHK